MSIVKRMPELPKEGQVVYADNGGHSSDRASFEGGEFVVYPDFPVRGYKMSSVSKWFDLEEYSRYYQDVLNKSCYDISFEQAELIPSQDVRG